MKISMWIIKKELAPYIMQETIISGEMILEKFQILPLPEGIQRQKEILYLEQQKDGVMLQAGPDSLLVSYSLSQLVNRLVLLFHQYQCWEERLRSCLTQAATLQELLNTFEEQCPYPIVFMELDGSILALSQDYREDEVNDGWFHMKTTLQVPMSSNREKYNEIHENLYVDETPRIFPDDNGGRYIGVYFTRNQVRFMGMIVIETQHAFTPDILQLCSFFAAMIRQHMPPDEEQSRTKASILYDLLEENPVTALDLDRFYENEAFIFPWYLAVINPDGQITDDVAAFLTDSFQKNPKLQTVLLNYNDSLVVMVQQIKLPLFLQELGRLISLSRYRIGISMAFHSLQKLKMRYQQALFAQKVKQKTGIRYCQQYALDYMTHSLRQNQNALEMIHPALAILREADARKNSQLYDTLWQYLNHDRSINATAEAMFVHRNSMLYRVKRIRELTDIDTDDLKECEYLRLSFLIENDHGITW